MKKLVALLFVFSLVYSQFSLAAQAGKFSAFGVCDVIHAEEQAAAEKAEGSDEKKIKNEGEEEPDCD